MNINKLWQKYKSGTATSEELTELDTNLQSKEGIAQLEAILQTEWQQTPSDVVTNFSAEATFDVLKKRIKQPESNNTKRSIQARPLRVVKTLRRVAAAVLLIAASTVIWWQVNKIQAPIVQINDTKSVLQISLSDGTKVWLNRQSKITYQKDFKDSIRQVALEGEAFFEVATDSLKPFIVLAGEVQTRVLGTSFNVRAFQAQSEIEVALVTGKIQVSIASDTSRNILIPGEKLTYSIADKKYNRDEFKQDEPYGWKDEIIYFQKATVQEVAQKLQAWYDIRFTIEQEEKIHGTLVLRYDTKEMTLDEILTNISSVMDYKFVRKKKNEILIRPK